VIEHVSGDDPGEKKARITVRAVKGMRLENRRLSAQGCLDIKRHEGGPNDLPMRTETAQLRVVAWILPHRTVSWGE